MKRDDTPGEDPEPTPPQEPAPKRAGRRTPWWRRPITIISAIVVLVLVGGGITAFALTRPQTQASRTYTVATTTLEQTVSATGTLQPASQADLSFASSGTVQTVAVKVGDTVAVGQTLATIDPSTLQSDVDLAQATVAQAQAQVSAASGSTAVAAANAQLASANAKLALAQSALAGATMTSPIAGVVASVGITAGTTESGGSGSTGSSSTTSRAGSSGAGGAGTTGNTGSTGGTASSSTAQITVISPTQWIVNASVGSSDLASLKAGLQAQITPTGARQPLFGTVQTIGIVATSSGTGAATFPVTIAVTGDQTGLYSGTTASVSITVKELSDVLAVPTLALSSSGGKTTVTVQKNGKDSTVPVTVGQVYGAQTQITSGLAAGDVIVLPNFFGTGTGTGTGTTGRTGTGGFGGGGFGGGGSGFGGGGGGFGGGGQRSGGNG